jgi:hypothetical protein
MADFSKELEYIKELLEEAYNKGYIKGEREGEREGRKAFKEGKIYRHKKLEEKGVFFNVGDRVRTLTFIDWEGISVFPCGTVGTIIERHKSDTYGVMLYTIKADDYDYTTYLYGAADLELVESAKVPVKVGSIVKIVKEYNDYNPFMHLFDKGRLGVIVSIGEDLPEKSTNGIYKYGVKVDGTIFSLDRDCFEVVTRIEEDK